MGSSNETAEDQQQLQQHLVVHQATIEDDPRRQQQTKMTFQQVVEQKMKEKQAGSKKHVMFLPSQGSAGHEAPARLAIKKRELIKSSELTSPVDPPVPLPPSSGTSLPLMLVDDILREEEEEEEQGEAATAGTGRVTNTIIFIFGRRHKNSITKN